MVSVATGHSYWVIVTASFFPFLTMSKALILMAKWASVCLLSWNVLDNDMYQPVGGE